MIRLTARQIAERLGRPPPTDEQIEVIQAPLEPSLVVAGAGSGKTETMAARVVYLVANALVRPEEVLGLTFTRKAAGELRGRVRDRLLALRAVTGTGAAQDGDDEPGCDWAGHDGAGTALPTVSTYHSFAANLVAEHGLRIGVEPHAAVLGEAAGWQLAATTVLRSDVGLQDIGTGPDHLTGQLVALSGACAEHLVSPEQVRQWCTGLADRLDGLPVHEPGEKPRARRTPDLDKVVAGLRARARLAPLVAAMNQRKRDRGALDFGDQVQLAARIAAVPEVAQALRSRFRVVLLDEFQDTSFAQLRMLQELFAAGHPVTAVGDPHQSIYGWRGASAGNLQSFPATFRRRVGATWEEASVFRLATSWRNDAGVLACANALAEPLARASPIRVPQLRARPGAGHGCVQAAWYETRQEEIDALAADLAGVWQAEQNQVQRGELPAGRRTSMAVLCRRRADFPVVEDALRARGVPVRVFGLGGLLERPEIGDIVATLQVLADPARGDALLRLLTGPRWRIGPPDLRALAAWARQLGAASRVDTAGQPGIAGQPGTADQPDTTGQPGTARPADCGPPVAGPEDDLQETGIVEALDALPEPGWHGRDGERFSEAGLQRLTRLSGELRRLRERVAAVSLPELIALVVRTLDLDVEIGASTAPGALANIDAFLDAAADFARTAEDGQDRLVGFLAWLAAAAERERGLEQGTDDVEHDPNDTFGRAVADRGEVHLLTVHAAKGLEWDVVAVPGLVQEVFPAVTLAADNRARAQHPAQRRPNDQGWATDAGLLPYPLRGDRAHLPRMDLTGTSRLAVNAALDGFKADCGAYRLDEERRLAYVAVTRARTRLRLSGSWWRDGKRPRTPSLFLTEILSRTPGVLALDGIDHDADGTLCVGGATQFEENPALAGQVPVPWPQDPLGAERAAVQAAADLVEAATTALARGESRRTAWSADVDALLAERAAAGVPATVALPTHLSASRAVALAKDPEVLALQLRRPVPTEPQPAARRGTAFHAWVERRLNAQPLVDVDDLPGSSDDAAAPEADLGRLQAGFESSEWATRHVVAVEVPIETPVAGTILRGRLDAVFAREDGGVDIVDWKTGAPPAGQDLDAVAVQLAVYRVAWSRLHDLPVERVHASFCYVAAGGRTVSPVAGMDEDTLVQLITRIPRRPDGAGPDREPAEQDAGEQDAGQRDAGEYDTGEQGHPLPWQAPAGPSLDGAGSPSPGEAPGALLSGTRGSAHDQDGVADQLSLFDPA